MKRDHASSNSESDDDEDGADVTYGRQQNNHKAALVSAHSVV